MINYKTGDVKKMSLKEMGETLEALPKIHGEILYELIEKHGMHVGDVAITLLENYMEFLKENDPTAFKKVPNMFKKV